ncbi:MAG: hypothetical protein JST82_03345 [Bacteroidetes bacterium]|nr:hypothetical protein [Bacteroidota bacterium]
MKNLPLLCLLICIVFFSCQRGDDPVIVDPPSPTVLKGGKGGTHNLVPFAKRNGGGVAARVFLKYAADKAPADTNNYDEKATAVSEPGYSHHVHFKYLTAGTYVIRAMYDVVKADTVIVITDTSGIELDFDMNMK